MSYFLASFIVSGVLHGWLVYRHRNDNPASISYHAMRGSLEHGLFVVGHLLNGLLIVLFVNELFISQSSSLVVLILTGVVAGSEWLQAVLPARGKTDRLHTVMATIMALSMTILVLCLSLLYAPNKAVLAINVVASLSLLLMSTQIKHPPPEGTWKIQLSGQLLLYLQLFLLVL